jgi:hypothetical protein
MGINVRGCPKYTTEVGSANIFPDITKPPARGEFYTIGAAGFEPTTPTTPK